MRFWFCCLLLTGCFLLVGCGSLLPAPATPTLTEKEAKQTKQAGEAATQPPPATPTPLPSVIVNILGNYLLNIDPMDRVLETKFEVMDASYGPDTSGNVILDITVNCNGLCSRERTFAVTMEALSVNQSILNGMIPSNLTDLHVHTLYQLQPSGAVMVKWKDVTDYFRGVITGTQLVSHISRP
jgi:hypothetical protein